MCAWDTVLVEYTTGRGRTAWPFYAIEDDPWHEETATTGQLNFTELWRA